MLESSQALRTSSISLAMFAAMRKLWRPGMPTMCQNAKLFRATLTALLMLAALGRAAVAGPFEDANAALQREDYATAYRLFRSLADSGNVFAQGIIGIMYAKGQGVPQNDAEAVKWYRLAADQGNAAAQLSLASMYSKGRGVPQSDAEAVTWYRRAADQGEAWAQTNLGAMYARGQGVPRDYVTAYMWFDLSAAQGDQVAVSDRDAAARRMTPEQIAEAQKLAREWKPKPER
jgi:TPR repeat protein